MVGSSFKIDEVRALAYGCSFDAKTGNYIQRRVNSWGRIIPEKIIKKQSSSMFDIYDESYTIGRNSQSCDWVVEEEDLNEQQLDRVSKTHCRVRKDCSNVRNPVYIEDVSRNGTFLNGQLIGLNRKRILKSYDTISFNTPSNVVFRFINTYQETYDAPEEIFKQFHIGKQVDILEDAVRLVIDRKTDDHFVMKVVQKNTCICNVCRNGIMREFCNIKKLVHPNIIRCTNVVMKETVIYVVMKKPFLSQFFEYNLHYGHLSDRIERQKFLSEDTSRHFFKQLCSAVKYLHDRNVTQIDIRLDNIILLSEDERAEVKLCDSGLTKLLYKSSRLRSFCRSAMYVAPEIVNTVVGGSCTGTVDIWSLGVVLYAMLSGTFPFTDNPKIHRYEIDFEKVRFQNIPEIVKDLIRTMLSVNQMERPTIDQVLAHPWMKNQDITTLVSMVSEPALAETTQTEPMPTETTLTETLTETTLTDTMLAEPTLAETMSAEPTQAETTQTEPMQAETTQAEPMQEEQTQAEQTQKEQTQAESTLTEAMLVAAKRAPEELMLVEPSLEPPQKRARAE